MNNSKPHPESYLKIRKPCRDQFEIRMDSLEDILPANHKARLIWDFVIKMDTNPCFRKIKSLIGHRGKPATDPHVLLALWLLAITDGVTSGRKIAEDLVLHHDAYKWIAGGITFNRTTVCNFRSANPLIFEELLTSSLAVLFKEGLLEKEDVAQDGSRIKAAAGKRLFRRKESLEELQKKAKQHLEVLHERNKHDPNDSDKRQKSAQLRAARERSDGIEKALQELRKLQTEKKSSHKSTKAKEKSIKNTRCSLVDPEARLMKMNDGGFKIAYNVQFATGTKSRTIYGVLVGNKLDPVTLSPLMGQVYSRDQKLGIRFPENWIADAAYPTKENIESSNFLFPKTRLVSAGKSANNSDYKKIRKDDSGAVKQWRQFVDTEEHKEIYSQRCSSAEFSNAQVKNHGFIRFRLLGLLKAKGEAFLHAIAQNMMRYWDLKKCKQSS